jgi:methionine-rich copper-binding protein CopC
MIRRLAAGALAVGTAIALTATPASAHTTLTAANPAKDATVSSPSQIVLTYADPVRLPRVILMDASKKQYQSGSAQAVDNKVTQAVNGALPNGKYTVGWRVVASDGHPVEGTYTFTVTGSSAAAQPAAPAPSAAAATSAEKSSGSSGWLWIGLIVLVIALAGGAVAWLRRSSTSED